MTRTTGEEQHLTAEGMDHRTQRRGREEAEEEREEVTRTSGRSNDLHQCEVQRDDRREGRRAAILVGGVMGRLC